MTETTNGARSAGRKRSGKGVTVQRIFTTPGVHPYDEVVWERRDVVQQNWKSGETIFEQRGVSGREHAGDPPRLLRPLLPELRALRRPGQCPQENRCVRHGTTLRGNDLQFNS